MLAAARAASAAAALWAGVNPLAESAWVRFDSHHYLSIAQHGYSLAHCTPDLGYPASAWCGNAGWFPLYAWLLRLCGSGALLSLVLEAAMLTAVWRLLLREESAAALALAAFFPGNIYQQAVFPTSLVVLCAVFVLARRHDAAAGALATLAYPTGALLAAVAALQRRWIAVAAIAAAGIAVLAVLQAQTGHWDAYFLVQRKYGFAFAPVDTLFSRLKPLIAAGADFGHRATAVQTLLVLAMVALAAARWRTNRAVAAYTAIYWAFPLCLGGAISLYRAEALLVPVVALIPPRARLPLLAAAVPLSLAMSAAFFRGALI